MTKKNLWFGIPAIALVFTMMAVGCDIFNNNDDDNGGGKKPQTATYTGTSGGTAYTLKVIENTARYTAQNGDAYELTVGSKKSTGTVSNVAGGVLTLKPSNATTTFTATVSGTSLTALNDTITWTDNTTDPAPGELTGGNQGGGEGGTFTLSGIPSEYNGKYAILAYDDEGYRIFGAQSVNMSTQTFTLCLISNGRVSLPLWTANNGETTFVRYSGNNTCDIKILILNTQTFTGNPTGLLGYLALSSVTFANGNAARTWSQGEFNSGSGGDGGGNSGGMTWTLITNSTIDYVTAIAYGNGKFVVGGWDGYGSKMAYSSDCVSWTAVDSIFDDEPFSAITYGNGKFVAGGHSGTIAWSSDAVTWTAVTNSTFGSSGINAIAYGNNKFVAGGHSGKMAYSSDGITWTAVTNSTFGENSILAIAYGNNKFVAGGSDGKMAYSSDAVTWTAVTNSTFVSHYIRGIAYGSNKFVAVGIDDEWTGKIAYSSDGVNWTAVSNSTFGKREITSLGYGNGKFIAGGEDGKMAYSSDGATWTAVNVTNIFGSTRNDHVDCIAYGNGKFVAGGNNGKMAYSTDN